MILAYLFEPNMQIQDRNGSNNVNGFLRVYLYGTDDRATTYRNFDGTLNSADIRLDNNGRAVVIVDATKAYRLEVYDRHGILLWTQQPLSARGEGINEGDINPLVVNRKLQDGTPQQQTYDPLQTDQHFDFGRVKFRKNGSVVGSYDPFDSDKIIDLPEDATVVLVSVDAANLNTVLADILSNAKLPVLQNVGGSTDERYDYSGKDANGDFVFYRITESEIQLAVVSNVDGTVNYATLDLNNGGNLSFAQLTTNMINTVRNTTHNLNCEVQFKRGSHISVVNAGADEGCVHLKAGTYYCSAVVDITAVGPYTPEYSTNRFRMFGSSFYDNSDHSYQLEHLMTASLIVTVPTGGQNYRLDFRSDVDDIHASVTSLSIIQLHDAEAPVEGHEYSSANDCLDIDNFNDVIEFKYARELTATATDRIPYTLDEKIAAQHGLKVTATNVSGAGQPAFYKLYIEPVTDPSDPDALAKLTDLEALVESRILENIPVGATTSEISQLADSTGKLTMSLCHTYMDFEIRKAHGDVAATKATVYITNCNSTQKLRVVVFQPIYHDDAWRYALIACSADVVIQDLSGNWYAPSDPNNLDAGGILTVNIEKVYDGAIFDTVANIHTVKSTDDIYIGIVATGTSLGAVGSHIHNGGTVNVKSARLVAKMSNVNANWDPDDYQGLVQTKNIDVSRTDISDGNRVYVELHNV